MIFAILVLCPKTFFIIDEGKFICHDGNDLSDRITSIENLWFSQSLAVLRTDTLSMCVNIDSLSESRSGIIVTPWETYQMRRSSSVLIVAMRKKRAWEEIREMMK